MEQPLPGRTWLKRVILRIVAMIVLAGGAVYWYMRPAATPAMSTPFQAVLLSNGSAYFGRLEGLGTPFPVLRDVFYVQSSQDPQTKQVSNILVKRGKEWHASDRSHTAIAVHSWWWTVYIIARH
jgi:hypothetical protein